jgi:hypothetical protein
MGDHLQNLPPSMRYVGDWQASVTIHEQQELMQERVCAVVDASELHNTLHQGTLDLIDRKIGVERRVPAEARRLIQNTVQRQTNRWICSLRVKEQVEFDGWLQNIYSVISQVMPVPMRVWDKQASKER